MNFDTGDIISAVMMIVGVSTFIIGNVRATKKHTEEEQKEVRPVVLRHSRTNQKVLRTGLSQERRK